MPVAGLGVLPASPHRPDPASAERIRQAVSRPSRWLAGNPTHNYLSGLSRLAELREVRTATDLTRGTWTAPPCADADFEAEAFRLMSPEGAAHLIAARRRARAAEESRPEGEATDRPAAELESLVSRMAVKAGVPPGFTGANFDRTERGAALTVTGGNAKAVRVCRSLAGRWVPCHRGLTLSSPDSGVGKTYLALAVMMVIIRKSAAIRIAKEGRGARCRFVTAPALLALFRDSYGATWDSKPGVMGTEEVRQAFAVSPDFLVIDDFGAEKVPAGEAGDWARERYWELLSHRFERGLTTMVTTNLTDAEIGARYGERIKSRLMGNSPLITLAGPDFRQKVRPDAEDPFFGPFAEDAPDA